MSYVACPFCESENLEDDDPFPGEQTCRDCGALLDAFSAADASPPDPKGADD